MTRRPALAALLAVLLIAACRVHVTIGLPGHVIARPPVAGLLLGVLTLLNAVLLWLAWREYRSGRPGRRRALA